MIETYTRDQIAEWLKVTPQTISNWASSGYFPKPIKGGNYLFSKPAVDLWMQYEPLPESTLRKMELVQKIRPRLSEFEKYAP